MGEPEGPPLFRLHQLGVVFATLAGALLPRAAAAAPATFTIERFEPLPSPGLNLLGVSTSRLLASGRASIGAQLHFARGSLTVVRTDPAEGLTATLVDDRAVVDLMASLGLLGHFELGVALPVVLHQDGGPLTLLGHPGATVSGTSLGDLRVVTKLRFWYPEDAGGFGLHLLLPVAFPTGDASQFGTEGAVTAQPTLGLDYRHGSGLTLAINVGWLFRPDRTYAALVRSDELRWSAGLEVPTSAPPLSAWLTAQGALPTEDNRDPLDPSLSSGQRDLPIEVLAGLRLRLGDDFALTLGAGAGVGGDVGAPDLRATFGFAVTPTASVRDEDGDGLRDVVDACPEQAEDGDGFQDDDGCPDLDNDADRIPDAADDCPQSPEDHDGFADADGCPDLDNDEDRVPDAQDRCPDLAEDLDGFEDADGCPDLDNDGDGIPDAKDSCPHEPEDLDGFQDGDGCVDPDNDRDGILDGNDLCPDLPETFNNIDDTDGCPDTPSRFVKVLTDEIRLVRPIPFTKLDASVKPVAFPVLDDVARLLLSNAQLTRVRVEGHAGDFGVPKRDDELGLARAKAVRDYLVARGVDPAVLEVHTLGSTRPIALEDTEVGHAQNRRVEFRIIEINGRPVEPTPKSPK